MFEASVLMNVGRNSRLVPGLQRGLIPSPREWSVSADFWWTSSKHWIVDREFSLISSQIAILLALSGFGGGPRVNLDEVGWFR